MKVGIYIKNGVEDESLKEFIKELDFYKIDNYIFSELEKNTDLIVVFGGDGTILAAAQFAVLSGVPIVAVNRGKLGFLSAYEPTEVKKLAKLISDNSLKFTKRSILELCLNGKNHYALNDVVVERDKAFVGASVTCKLSLDIGENSVYDLSSDGVIISTPTGSTAYSLSAGGVILAPDIKSFIATPICSHSLSTRPIVYADDSVSEITLNESSADCIVSVDGRPIGKLTAGDKISVKKSEITLLLAESEYNFYTKIKNKLG